MNNERCTLIHQYLQLQSESICPVETIKRTKIRKVGPWKHDHRGFLKTRLAMMPSHSNSKPEIPLKFATFHHKVLLIKTISGNFYNNKNASVLRNREHHTLQVSSVKTSQRPVA